MKGKKKKSESSKATLLAIISDPVRKVLQKTQASITTNLV